MNYNFWKTYWPVFAWAAILFIQSSIPNVKAPLKLTQWDDKWIHAVIYFPLGFLLLRALRQKEPQSSTAKLLLLTFLVGTAYGISDEFHQYFVPGRFSDWRDVLADAVGVILGSAGYLKYEQRQRTSHQPNQRE